MSIKKPSYAPDAVATNRGWESPKGELLVSHKGLKDKLGVSAPAPKKSKPAPKPEVVEDAGPDFASMSKDELESWARENLDVELDKRQSKKSLIEEIKELM